MRITHTLLAGTVMASAALAGPIKTSDVPAKSSAVVHVNLEALLDSDIGEFVLEHADGLGELDEVRREIGIDPLKDIRDVTVCLLGDDEEDVVVLATVSDALEDVLDKLDEFGDEIDHDVRHRYGGDLHTFNMDGNEVAALVREGRGGYRIAISPNADLLKIVGETIDGDRDSIRGRDHDLGRFGGNDNAFVQLVVFDLGDLPMHADLPSQIAGKINGVIAEIGEDDGQVFCNARIGVEDEDDAENLVRLANGASAFLELAKSMNEGHDEEIAMAMELLKNLRIKSDGSVIDIRLKLDTDMVMELIEQAD